MRKRIKENILTELAKESINDITKGNVVREQF